MSFLSEGKTDVINIFNRLRKRDFSGYFGLAIKNSLYQFSTSWVSQVGTLLFTIIIARMLLPELFGLYSLALSTIILFASFSDMSTGTTLMKFVSSALGKKKISKAKSYTYYLLKVRIWLTCFVAIVLLAASKFIANNYYHKPIFLALVAGVTYLFFSSMVSFFTSVFMSSNNFKQIFHKEIFFQIVRLVIVPLSVVLTLKSLMSQESIILIIILALTFSQFVVLLFLIARTKRLEFLKGTLKKISSLEKKKINKFMLPLSATALSGIFFGYIDIVMLGKFVSGEFIGYYRAAFSLVGAIIPLIAFSLVLFPIFGRLKGARLESSFKKSVKLASLTSLILIPIIVFASPLIINLIFGKEYTSAVPIFQILSLIVFSTPIIDLYTTYIMVKGNTKVVAQFLITSTIMNIALNYFLITWFLSYSQFIAVIGAAIATLISRYLLLVGLVLFKKYKMSK